MGYARATVIVKASHKTGAFVALEELYNSVKNNYDDFGCQEDGSVHWELSLIAPDVSDTNSTKREED
jgi:hypothetical protein